MMVAKVGHAVCLFRYIAFPVGPSRYNRENLDRKKGQFLPGLDLTTRT